MYEDHAASLLLVVYPIYNLFGKEVWWNAYLEVREKILVLMTYKLYFISCLIITLIGRVTIKSGINVSYEYEVKDITSHII